MIARAARSPLAAVALALAAIAVPSRAARAEAPRTDAVAPAAFIEPASARLVDMWRLELGYRGSFVTNAGYNPFSTIDYFPQLSVSASRTVYARGRFSFAPGIAWDYGKTGANSRGDATSLDVHRLVVPLEGRLHLGRAGRAGYAFVRVAPGLAVETASVEDASAPAPLTRSRWLVAGDVSGGYAFPLLPRLDVPERAPRLWVQADGGYGWVADQRLDLAADVGPGEPASSGIDLGTLGLRGAFFRIALAVSL